MRVTDRFRIRQRDKDVRLDRRPPARRRGKLSLDDTVERRLPGLIPNGSDITVRQLLNHTSGLYDYAEDNAFLAQLDNRRKVWAPRQLIALGTAHKPAFLPGTKWGYSNTGYIALGLMVEDQPETPSEQSCANGSSSPSGYAAPASTRDHRSRAATPTATRGSASHGSTTPASSIRPSSGPPARSSRPWTTSPASTTPSSADASSVPTCLRP